MSTKGEGGTCFCNLYGRTRAMILTIDMNLDHRGNLWIEFESNTKNLCNILVGADNKYP
jgi:hypothetical protein